MVRNKIHKNRRKKLSMELGEFDLLVLSTCLSSVYEGHNLNWRSVFLKHVWMDVVFAYLPSGT